MTKLSSLSENDTLAIRQMPINIASGMCTGVTIAGLFHPWDRALFLSVTNNRPFLYEKMNSRFVTENFVQPYHGFAQTIIARTISNSL